MTKTACATVWVLLAAVLASGAAMAVTYTYAGANFTTANGAYDTTMSVSVQFSVDVQFPPNMSSTDVSAQVTSYSLSDGVQTLTEANSEILAFSVTTGTGGDIRHWAITAWATPITTMVGGELAGIDTFGDPTGSGDAGYTDGTCSQANGPGGRCSGAVGSGGMNNASVLSMPGAWSCGACVIPPVASDRVWTESGDAPSFPDGPAQVTRGQGTLLAISGATDSGSGDPRDAYCIRIVDPFQFLATTDARSDANGAGDFNTRLYLFEKDGAPRLANDDRSPQQFPFRSTITLFSSDPGFGPPFPGEYVLVVAGAPDRPEDGAGVRLFGTGSDPEAVLGPNPAGGRFDHWDAPGGITATGAYTVVLGGTEYCQSDLDLAFANDGSADQFCLGDNAGEFSCADLNGDRVPKRALALGFLAFNRHLDAVFAVGDLGPNRVCLGDGVGGFACSDVSTDSADLNSTADVALGFVDGDQILDAVFANVDGTLAAGLNRVCLGDPTGGFSCSDVSPDKHVSEGVALGFVDGDSNLDAVFANDGAANRVCLGDGMGGFTGCSDVSADTNATVGVALGRVDGDPHLDAVFVNPNRPSRLCLGDGAGGFSSCSDFGADTNNGAAVALGLVDGDAHLDAVFANLGQPNRVCLGDGTGRVACADVSPDTNDSEDVALGLIDGDAHLDAAFGNNGQVATVCFGDGTGSFPTCISPPATRSATRGVALGEVVLSEIFADGFE